MLLLDDGRRGTPYLTLNGATYAGWKAGLAARAAGTRNARLLCVGMSTTRGVGAAGGIAQSWPTRLAIKLSALGTPAGYQSWLGDGNVGFSLDARIDQVSIGTTTPNGIGCRALIGNAVTDYFDYYPSVQSDTVVIYWARVPGGGTINWAINGGATTGISTDGAEALMTTTASTGANITRIRLSFPSGSSRFYGLLAFKASNKIVDVINGGWSGMRSSDLAANTSIFNPINVIASYAPDLTIVSCDINDWITANGVSLSTYTANLTAFVTAAKAAGDVLMISSSPSAIASASQARQQDFVNAEKAVAASLGVGFSDQWSRYGTWDAANTAGFMADGLHMNGAGYDDFATGVLSALRAL